MTRSAPGLPLSFVQTRPARTRRAFPEMSLRPFFAGI